MPLNNIKSYASCVNGKEIYAWPFVDNVNYGNIGVFKKSLTLIFVHLLLF